MGEAEVRRHVVSRRGNRTVLDVVPLDAAEWIWVDDRTVARWQRALKSAAKAQREMDAAYDAARARRRDLSERGATWMLAHPPEEPDE